MVDPSESKWPLAEPPHETPGMLNSSNDNTLMSSDSFQQQKEPVAHSESTFGQFDTWFGSLKENPVEATKHMEKAMGDLTKANPNMTKLQLFDHYLATMPDTAFSSEDYYQQDPCLQEMRPKSKVFYYPVDSEYDFQDPIHRHLRMQRRGYLRVWGLWHEGQNDVEIRQKDPQGVLFRQDLQNVLDSWYPHKTLQQQKTLTWAAWSASPWGAEPGTKRYDTIQQESARREAAARKQQFEEQRLADAAHLYQDHTPNLHDYYPQSGEQAGPADFGHSTSLYDPSSFHPTEYAHQQDNFDQFESSYDNYDQFAKQAPLQSNFNQFESSYNNDDQSAKQVQATSGLDDPIYDFLKSSSGPTEQAPLQSNFEKFESSYNNSHQSGKRTRDASGLDDPTYDSLESSSRPTKQARYSYNLEESESFHSPPSPPPTSPTKNVQKEAVVDEQNSEYDAASPSHEQPTREHGSDFDSDYDATPLPGKQSTPEHDSDWDSEYDATPCPRKERKSPKTTKVRGNESRNVAPKKITKSDTKATKNQTKKKGGNRMLAELAAANKPGKRELEDLQKEFGSSRGVTKRSREDDEEDDTSIKPAVKKQKSRGSFFERQPTPDFTQYNTTIIEYRSRSGVDPQFFDVGDMGITQQDFDNFDAGMKSDLVRMLPRADGPGRVPSVFEVYAKKSWPTPTKVSRKPVLPSSDDEEDGSGNDSRPELDNYDNEKEDGNSDVGPSDSDSDSDSDDDDDCSRPTGRKTYTGGKTYPGRFSGKTPRKTYTGGKTPVKELYGSTNSRASSSAASESPKANAARNRRCKDSVSDDDNSHSEFDDDDDSDDDDAFMPPSTQEPVSRAPTRNANNTRTALPSSRSTSTNTNAKGNNKKLNASASASANTKPHGNTGQTKNRAWDNNSQEANLLNRYIQDRRALEAQNPHLPKLKDMKLYEGAAAELRKYGITHRTANACKLYWGRAGRQHFQFEERENASNPLGATSTQGPARTRPASASSRKTPAQTQAQSQQPQVPTSAHSNPSAALQMNSYAPASAPVSSSAPNQIQAAPQAPPQAAPAQQMNAQQQQAPVLYESSIEWGELDEDDASNAGYGFDNFDW